MINSMIKQVYNLVREFDYKEFFSYSGTDNNGASVLITPRQAITMSNLFDGMAPHETTLQMIATVIYNYSNPLIDARLIEDINRLVSLSIRMRLISEQGQKMIQIFFPDKITREQINLLSAYQNTHGEKVEKVSIHYKEEDEDSSPIVVFKGHDGKDNYSHSFKEAKKYAETLSIVEKLDLPYESIIGSVISSDGLTLCECDLVNSLGEFVNMLLEKGINIEDDKKANEHIRYMLELIKRSGLNERYL